MKKTSALTNTRRDDAFAHETQSILVHGGELEFPFHDLRLQICTPEPAPSTLMGMWVKLMVQFVCSEEQHIDQVIQKICNYELRHEDQTWPLRVRKDTSGYFTSKAIRERQNLIERQAYAQKFREDSAAANARFEKYQQEQAMVEHVAKLDSTLDHLEILKRQMLENETLRLNHSLLKQISHRTQVASQLAHELELASKKNNNSHDKAAIVVRCRDMLRECQGLIVVLNREIRRVHMHIPSVVDVMLDLGTTMFLELCQKVYPSESSSSLFQGCTMLVPENEAFYENLATFETQCWDVHVLDGAYRIADLAQLNGGFVRSCKSNVVLRVKITVQGTYTAWIHGDSNPPSRARIRKADIVCQNGTIVHLVDRILMPEFGYT